jgi:hypothetical protein
MAPIALQRSLGAGTGRPARGGRLLLASRLDGPRDLQRRSAASRAIVTVRGPPAAHGSCAAESSRIGARMNGTAMVAPNILQHVLEAEAQGLGSRAWDVVEPVVEFDLAFVRLDRRTHLFAPPAVAGRRGLPSAAGAAETVRRDPVHRTGDDVVVTSDRSEPAPGHDPGRGARSVSVCPGPGPHRLRSLPGRASDRVGGPGSSRRSAVRDVSRRPWRGTVSRR